MDKSLEIATLAGGCFWCTEAIFKRVKGVEAVESGYAGGDAESVQITFNPEIISYEKLLEIFFKLHDPTTLNSQGADIGSQYRSVIFYADEAQQKAAHDALKKAQKDYTLPIVTQITPFKSFSKAEDYHQDFYHKNPNASYCRLVIDPKIQKLMKDFKTSVILN